MTPLVIGLLIFVVTVAVLATGLPIAFGLGAVALAFMLAFDGWNSVHFVPETIFAGLSDFTLVSLPMFIIMGAAVASSRAGSDLYEALARWLHRVPGSLVISNIGACALFSALTGSSPATCAAIGKMGIPEMRKRGYDADLATGAIAAGGTLGILIPPSITMILYGIASETSIGRLFLAGVIPGLLLTALFMAWALFLSWKRGTKLVDADRIYSLKEKVELLPKLLPFIAVIVGVVYALYGGIATPSEAAGVGAALCLVMVIVIYRVWKPADLWAILRDGLRESGMLLMIIGTSILFGYMMSSLQVTQSVAEGIAAMQVNKWVVLAAINLMLLVAGMFLPPAAIILMTTPILMPVILAAGFDPIWFGVILTINMELGLITPPVGLNLFVINGITPDVKLPTILKGALPFMGCMVVAILILCVFPGLATWLPQVDQAIIEQGGNKVLADAWLAGGFAGKNKCVKKPEDAAGEKFRSAGATFSQMWAGAGASIVSIPSNEVYNALQQGVATATDTSSGSFVSFRLYEQLKCLTAPGDNALWFMYEPVLISLKSWNKLNDAQKAALMKAAQKSEDYFEAESKKLDDKLVETFKANKTEVVFLNEAEFEAWRGVAQKTSYKNFAEKVPGGKELLDKALSVK